MKKFRVGYLDRPPHEQFLKSLAQCPDVEAVRIATANGTAGDVVEQLATCHGYYVRAARDELPRQWQVSKELISRLPRLLMVSSHGAGYDTVVLADCTEFGVAVCNQAGGNAEAVAEHAIGLMLCLLKRVPEADRAVRAGRAGRREDFMGREIFGRTIGIVGLGHIGGRTAELLQAFRCKVLAYDPYLSERQCRDRHARKVDFQELLAQSDIVSVHCPFSDETRNMFSADAFRAMRPKAIFVSTARGGIHDESALYDGLLNGHIAGAGLDVWVKEPPETDHPLLSHPAVLTSSHIGGVTHESRLRVTSMAAESFISAARGIVPPRIVNPQVMEAFCARLAAACADWGVAPDKASRPAGPQDGGAVLSG